MNTYPNTNRPPRKPANKRLIRAGVIAAVVIVLALIVYGGCTAIVPTGYTGILTKEGFEAEGSELVYATLYQRPNGQRIWDLDWYIPAYVNGIEWSCCVRLDAQTGEILDCDAVTGGIG